MNVIPRFSTEGVVGKEIGVWNRCEAGGATGWIFSVDQLVDRETLTNIECMEKARKILAGHYASRHSCISPADEDILVLEDNRFSFRVNYSSSSRTELAGSYEVSIRLKDPSGESYDIESVSLHPESMVRTDIKNGGEIIFTPDEKRRTELEIELVPAEDGSVSVLREWESSQAEESYCLYRVN